MIFFNRGVRRGRGEITKWVAGDERSEPPECKRVLSSDATGGLPAVKEVVSRRGAATQRKTNKLARIRVAGCARIQTRCVFVFSHYETSSDSFDARITGVADVWAFTLAVKSRQAVKSFDIIEMYFIFIIILYQKTGEKTFGFRVIFLLPL